MAPAGDPRVQGSGLEIDPTTGSAAMEVAAMVEEDGIDVHGIKSGTSVGSGRRADSAVLKRQCYGHMHQKLRLEAIGSQPIDFLALDFCSNSAIGRMSYSGDLGSPLLAIGSTTDFGLTIWRHSFTSAHPAKLQTFNELHARPITDVRWLMGSDSTTAGVGGLLVTTSEDGTAKVVNVAAHKVLGRLDLSPHILLCAASADPNSVVLGYGSRWGVWDLRSPSSLSASYGAARGTSVADVAALWEAGVVLSATLDGCVRVWDVRKGGSGDCLSSFQVRPQDEGVASLHMHSDQTSVLVGCEGGVIYDVNLSKLGLQADAAPVSLTPEHPLVHRHYTGHANRTNLKRATRSGDGRYVMCGSDDSRVYLWHAESTHLARQLDGNKASELVAPHATQMPLLSAAMSPTPASRFQLAFCSNQGAFLFSYRERADGCPLGEDDWEVELLDDSLVEQAGQEQHETLDSVVDGDEDDAQAWETDNLGLDDNECSYGRGYVTQLVYVCDTCANNVRERSNGADDGMHALCIQCAHRCHEFIGHTVRNIGEKRDFRCDCGIQCFRQAGRLGGHLRCTLQGPEETRDQTNAHNAYNHNFLDRWCYCDGPESLPMVQCIGCKDWYHPSCIHEGYDFAKDEFDQGEDYICKHCLQKPELAFLAQYPSKSPVIRPAFTATAEGEEEEEEEEGAAPANVEPPSSSAPTAAAGGAVETAAEGVCGCCRGGALAGVPSLALLRCAGTLDQPTANAQPVAAGSEDSKAGTQTPCAATFHPACLPPGAAELDHLGRWFCRACSVANGMEDGGEEEEEESDLSTAQVDWTLPPLGWRMAKGRFVEPGWVEELASDEHKDMVQRALGTVEAPVPVQRTVGMGTAVAAAMTNMLAASSAPVASGATAAVAVAGGQPEGGEDLEAEIRRAVLAGDEAKAFRLAMQKILSTAFEDAHSSRRGFILAQDVQRAAQQVREEVSRR